MVNTPHFPTHFAFNARGETVVVEQESPEDLEARAYNVCVCPIGFREDNPDFGIPELVFRQIPLDLTAVQSQVTRWAALDLSLSEHAEGLETAARAITAEVGPQ